jgi:hypothetical protein
MAVAFDAASTHAGGNSANPSWTHTPVGTPTGVGISISWRQSTAGALPTITSVTYGGQSCTLEDSQLTASGLEKTAIYSLANPPSGAQTVSVTFSAGPNRQSASCAVTVTGGDTSDVFSNVAKATSTSTTPTVNVSSATDELVMDSVVATTNNLTEGAGQTNRMELALSSARAASSTEAGAATVTMSWTMGSSQAWATVAASFKASTGGLALTGSSSTVGQTAPTPTPLLSISGQASTSASGSVTPSASAALTGLVITASQESLDDSRGQVFFSAQGSLNPGLSLGISGQAITSAQGSVTVADTGGDNVTVHISGVQASFSQGIFLNPVDMTPGQSATSAAGTVTPSSTVPLTGSASTLATGTVTPDLGTENSFIQSASGTASPEISKALTGSEITSAHGTISAAANDETEAISGPEITVEAGTVTPVPTIELTGQEITSDLGNFGAPGFVALTGQSVSVDQGNFGREYPLSGQGITSSAGTILPQNVAPGNLLLFNNLLTAQQGNVTAVNSSVVLELTGQESTLSQGTLIYGVIDNKTAALTGSAITSAAGSVTASSVSDEILLSLTGQVITSEQGSLKPPTLWVPIDDGTTDWTPESGATSPWTTVSGGTTTWTPE